MQKAKRKRMSSPSSTSARSVPMSKKQEKLYCRETWEAFDWEKNFCHTFHADQVRVARYLYTYPKIDCFEAFWDMGIGKTPLGFLWSETQMCKLWRTSETPSLTIVVASPTLQANFREKLRTWMTCPPKEREAHIRFFYRFWSREKIGLHPNEFMRQCRNNFVLIDESHQMRTKIELQGSIAMEGKQSYAMLKGTKLARAILRCSGTPIPDTPFDLQNALWQYQRHVPIEGESSSKYPNLQLVKDIYKYRISRVTQLSPDQEKKMPTMIEVQCLIEMAPEFYEAYRKVEENEMEQLRAYHNESGLSGTAACWSGLRQAVNKINSAPSQKREIAEQLILKRKLQGKRVVVSSQFLERGLDLFEKTFRKLFPRFAWVSYVLWMEETWIVGKMTQDERQKAINDFNDDTVPMDVMQISNAGNFGTSLGAGEVLINMDLHWNVPTRDQTNHRVCRFDSKGSVIVIYNLMMIKPSEYHRFHNELKRMIVECKGQPGIPHEILTFPHVATRSVATSSRANQSLLDRSKGAESKGLGQSIDQKQQGTSPSEQKKKDSAASIDQKQPKDAEIELESVDVRSFRLQLSKLKDSAPYIEALEASSIERLFTKTDEDSWLSLPKSLQPVEEKIHSENASIFQAKSPAKQSATKSHGKQGALINRGSLQRSAILLPLAPMAPKTGVLLKKSSGSAGSSGSSKSNGGRHGKSGSGSGSGRSGSRGGLKISKSAAQTAAAESQDNKPKKKRQKQNVTTDDDTSDAE